MGPKVRQSAEPGHVHSVRVSILQVQSLCTELLQRLTSDMLLQPLVTRGVPMLLTSSMFPLGNWVPEHILPSICRWHLAVLYAPEDLRINECNHVHQNECEECFLTILLGALCPKEAEWSQHQVSMICVHSANIRNILSPFFWSQDLHLLTELQVQVSLVSFTKKKSKSQWLFHVRMFQPGRQFSKEQFSLHSKKIRKCEGPETEELSAECRATLAWKHQPHALP